MCVFYCLQMYDTNIICTVDEVEDHQKIGFIQEVR